MTTTRPLLIGLLFAASFPAIAARKPKPPKPPSQEAIVKDCVTVFDIYSHSLSIFSGVGAPPPGIEAKVRNNCRGAVMVSLTIGYFTKAGVQLQDDFAAFTVAPGARYDFWREATLPWEQQGSMKSARIISVSLSAMN